MGRTARDESPGVGLASPTVKSFNLKPMQKRPEEHVDVVPAEPFHQVMQSGVDPVEVLGLAMRRAPV